MENINQASAAQSNDQPVKVELTAPANPPVFICGGPMVISTVCFLYWGNSIGIFGEYGAFTLGMIVLCLLPLFVMSARSMAKLPGCSYLGNIQLFVCFYFAFISSLAHILPSIGVPISPRAMGVHFLLSGLLFLLTLPSFKGPDKLTPIMNALTGIALIMFFFTTLGVAPMLLNVISAWIWFVVGCMAFYFAVTGYNSLKG